MKSLIRIALVLVAATALSCSEEEKSNLQISIKSSKAALINAGTRSCIASKTANSANDISSMYFSLLTPTITWNNTTATAYVDTVVIKLKSDNFTGGEQKCTISTAELLANYFSGSPSTTDITLSPGTGVTLTPTCPYRCGSISLKDSTRPFSALGTIEVRGFQVDSAGEAQSIKATNYFQLDYTP